MADDRTPLHEKTTVFLIDIYLACQALFFAKLFQVLRIFPH